MADRINIGTRVNSRDSDGEPVWLDFERGDVLVSGGEGLGKSALLRTLRRSATYAGLITVALDKSSTLLSMRARLDHLSEQCSLEGAPRGVVFIDDGDGDQFILELVTELLGSAKDRPYTVVVSGAPGGFDPALFASWIALSGVMRGDLVTGAQSTAVAFGPDQERASRFPVISAQQAAEYLDVTPGRIRQLVASGDLRRAPIPVRDLVLRRDDVERYAKRKLSAMTLRVHDVPTPPDPRALRYESLVVVAGRQLHVRLWRGGDGIAFLLVGHLRGQMVPPREELLEIAAGLFRLIPDLDPATTAYVELHTGDREDRDKYTLREVELQIPDVSNPGAIKFERALPVEWDELLRALGARPELYHVHGYTAPVVEEHLRTRRPVPVEDDRYKVRTKIKWLEALDQLGDHPVVEPLTRLIVDELWLWMRTPSGVRMALDDSGEFWVDESQQDEAALEEAQKALKEALASLARDLRGRDRYQIAGYPWAPTATQYVGVALPPRLQELLSAHPDDSFSYTREEGRRLRGMLLRLEHENQGHRPGANSDLHDAAAFGLDVMPPRQRLSLEERARQDLELPRPSHVERYWQLERRDPVSAAYLKAIAWQDDRASDFTTAEKADLEKVGWLFEIKKWGRAPDGDLVGTGRDSSGHKWVGVVQDIAASRPVEPDDALVSARIASGDVPLFIERDDRIVGMVPSHNVHMSMNFGYGGGGPGEAAAAVVDLLGRSGYSIDDEGFRKIMQRFEDPVWAEGTNVGLPIRDLLA
ncbi:helix-turn-helix domain-containing protein [Brachybacterium kimchii]|uniref:Helix-turn-helix domain-containing protein n=1 Tax=Brachybacterium kimchii TaxID=2942909 RepID=A0ABY4NDP0_9MICO|nr:helix-turn-helix domain-containing protein [Brachybacterium kimchii]UQN31775.1 helix-turn-helix domain-containing protein [Brachybacterium kimchii]